MVLEGRADLHRAVLCEQDFFKPLDFESQDRTLSTYMTADYYHSWVRTALPAPDPTLFPPTTPEVTQGQIVSQFPTDATSSR